MAIKVLAELASFQDGPDTVKVELDEISGKEKIQIRKWYTDENGELQPGRQGLTMTPANFRKLLDECKTFKPSK